MRVATVVLLLLCAIPAALTTPPAFGADDAPPPPPGPDVVKLKLKPTAVERPLLRYRLLPDVSEQTPGDAVKLYLLACRGWPDQKTTNEVLYPENEKFDYLGTPTAEFPPQYARRVLEAYAQAFDYADLGARRREAHWDTGWRERGLDDKSLSYMNDLRHVANLLGFRTRVRMLGKDWDGAAYSMQTMFGMARHVGTEPLLIHGLIQAGFTDLALYRGVQEWIAYGDSPNLYWALSDLPQPFIDLRAVAQWERYSMLHWKPALVKGARGELPADQWPAAVRGMVADLLESRPPGKPPASEAVEAEAKRLVESALPRAKQYLIDEAGLPRARVEAMGADEAVGTYFAREYQAAADELWKAWALPYPQASDQMLRAWRALAPDKPPASQNPAIQTHLVPVNWTAPGEGRVDYERPTLLRARYHMARTERYIALLRTVEAIRDHAARNGGNPPERLEQVTNLPVPADPMTGGPFTYRLEGDTAVLEAAAPEGMSVRGGWRFEMTFGE